MLMLQGRRGDEREATKGISVREAAMRQGLWGVCVITCATTRRSTLLRKAQARI